MKKEISFKATMIIDLDDYDDWNPETFDDVEDDDYDNVGRPIYHLVDVGWEITNKKIKTIK